MTTKPEGTDDESFIILGTSPGTSLDLKCNGMEGPSLDRVVLDDAIKDLPAEASTAFKAHFQLDSGDKESLKIEKDEQFQTLLEKISQEIEKQTCTIVENITASIEDKLNSMMGTKKLINEFGTVQNKGHNVTEEPSPASLMIASTMVTDDKTTEELQKQFGELLDENVILKETLKKNNESMKEQFLLIASCQEDMMKTHELHKEKFDETRELVEKLRQENKKLKTDIARLASSEPTRSTEPTSRSETSSGPMSALEFVTCPDDDTINKLTAQLDLVEKQRRQVIVENDKLTWQKESLEHIVDATSKERDELKEKVKELELQLSNIESEHTHKINLLNYTIQDLSNKLESAMKSISAASPEELTKRDEIIKQLNGKVSTLQSDLKHAKLKILELETVKLEFSKHKSGTVDTVKMYKDQIQELHNRLKEVQTTVFQPVRCSISTEGDTSNAEYGIFMANVKLYDKTLKHLADLLNIITHGNLSLLAHLQECKLNRNNPESLRTSVAELQQRVESQHTDASDNIAQVKGALSIFEGIFKDYNELLKKCLNNQEPKPVSVEQLTAALVARGEELQSLQSELNALRNDKEDKMLLQAQLDLYKSDFEAEREAREKMASDKETLMTDLRSTQRRNQELVMQLEEVRKLNPNIFRSATARRLAPTQASSGGSQAQGPPGSRRQSAPGNTTTGNMVYTCPKCLRFSSDQYKAMEDHFDFCLDDF